MIIEFIGRKQVRKMTLNPEVQRRLTQTTNMIYSFEMAASWLGHRS